MSFRNHLQMSPGLSSTKKDPFVVFFTESEKQYNTYQGRSKFIIEILKTEVEML